MFFESNDCQMRLTMLIESNESQTHSNKAFWIKWKSLHSSKLIDPNESQIHSNKPFLNKWKSNEFLKAN